MLENLNQTFNLYLQIGNAKPGLIVQMLIVQKVLLNEVHLSVLFHSEVKVKVDVATEANKFGVN